MLTVVLDDDPTGTQSASNVTVLLAWTPQTIEHALRIDGAVYLQTNSRALTPSAARALAESIRRDLCNVEHSIGQKLLVILRGDSTLRGHVFTETDVFAGDTAPVLFVPAFPQGGRRTVGSVHRIIIDGIERPVSETEFARDPIFGYTHSNLIEWTAEKGDRAAIAVPLRDLRESKGLALTKALQAATARQFVIPDAESDEDIALIHAGLVRAIDQGTRVVVRAGATLAAVCAGRLSTSYLHRPLTEQPPRVIVICGSHTAAATEQLSFLCAQWGVEPITVDTDLALHSPDEAGRRAAHHALSRLKIDPFVVIATDRQRRHEDGTLDHGAMVMSALMVAAKALIPHADLVISKGGITSAEVARTGFGARTARVRGQVTAGISVWDIPGDHQLRTQIVVPGNVGDHDALSDVMTAVIGTARQPAKETK